MRFSFASVALTISAMWTGADAFGVTSPLVQNTAFRQGRGSATKLEGVRNPPPDAATPIKAIGFLGLAGASVGLIIAAPFSESSSDFTMPELQFSLPKIQMEKVLPEKKAATSKKPSAPSKSDKFLQKSMKEKGYSF